MLSLQWLRSLLWHGFDPWPGNVHMLQVRSKQRKSKKTKNETNKKKTQEGMRTQGPTEGRPGDAEKVATSQPRRGASEETNPANTLTSDF